MNTFEFFSSLRDDIKDAPTEIKQSFNTLVNYFAEEKCNCLMITQTKDGFISVSEIDEKSMTSEEKRKMEKEGSKILGRIDFKKSLGEKMINKIKELIEDDQPKSLKQCERCLKPTQILSNMSIKYN